MARYRAIVHSPLDVEAAFARVADVSRFQEWDPGVLRSKRVRGDAPALGTAYDLTVRAIPPQVFRYETTAFDAPHRYLMVGKTRFFVSTDEISVTPREGGAAIVYDAELVLTGVLGVFDRGLHVVFKRIGDRAARGLAAFLEGTLVS